MIREFAPIRVYLLQRFGEELLRVREEQLKAMLTSHATILTRYEESVRRRAGQPSRAKPAIRANTNSRILFCPVSLERKHIASRRNRQRSLRLNASKYPDA